MEGQDVPATSEYDTVVSNEAGGPANRQGMWVLHGNYKGLQGLATLVCCKSLMTSNILITSNNMLKYNPTIGRRWFTINTWNFAIVMLFCQ